jgi:hypothetical protein
VRGESWQNYDQPLSDAQVEHRAVLAGESTPIAAEIEASELALLAKLNSAQRAEPATEDPLEEIMRRRSTSRDQGSPAFVPLSDSDSQAHSAEETDHEESNS